MRSSGFHRLRDPHDGIYFASTETATCWPGFIDGAVQAGWRSAGEVTRSFNKVPVDIPNIDATVGNTVNEQSVLDYLPVAVVVLGIAGALYALRNNVNLPRLFQ